MIQQVEIILRERPRGFHLVTREISEQLPSLPQTGLLNLFIKHTSYALSINENADPDVKHDLTLGFDSAFPDRPAFLHAEGNSDAHLKCSTVGASETVIIEDGKLLLGTWQGIYFCEFDGPRTRKYYVKVMEDK